MRGTSIKQISVSVGAAVLLWPVIAWADKTVQAGPPNRFTNPELTMDQGERLTFRNGDTVSHDVTASTEGADGKPLFSTPIVAAGKEAFVNGSEYLTEGHYAYICTLHPSMKGTIHVTANGTPKPRPEVTPDPAASADTVRPTLAMRIVSRSASMARVREALVVRVVLSEPSHLELRAVARPKAGGPLVTVAKRLLHKASGTKRVKLRLTPAGAAALRRDRSLAVIVRGTAIDPSGNMTRVDHGRTLTP